MKDVRPKELMMPHAMEIKTRLVVCSFVCSPRPRCVSVVENPDETACVCANMDGGDFPQRTPQNDAKQGFLDARRTQQPQRRQEVFDVFGQDLVPLVLVLVVLLLSKPYIFITRVTIDVTDLMGAAMTRCTC